MNYYKIVIQILDQSLVESSNEVVLAMLEDAPFDSFVETENGLEAFMPEKDWGADSETLLNDLSGDFGFVWERVFVPYQNWNAVWESNFEPIRVADFVGIRADFHPKTEGVRFDLLINPKMAFGTGHHETTHMMIEQMENMDFKDKKVLDYGCGTGVLAILAEKLGATELEAVDIEQPSYESTIENALVNDVHHIKAFFGTLDEIKSSNFDVILANINRNVILDSLARLENMLDTGGGLLLSGFMPQDENLMREAIEKHHFAHENTLKRGNWLCMKCVKK
ncbi:MAG: hypothetical protein RL757_2250 [Bacteroidota bacterium]|jgi:ribosomal protein L11 methyltransferase